MKLSTLSSLDYRIEGMSEIFEDPATGFKCRWNMDSITDDLGIQPHTGFVESMGNWSAAYTPALGFEMQFFPLDTPFQALQNSELTDRVKNSHQTGPENRRYVAPALRFAINDDTTRQAKGQKALIDFNLCQLNRPLGHQWLVPPREDLTINKKTQWAWDLDKNTLAGWNAFDVAHNDTSPEFALAALNHPLGIMNMWMLWRWFISAFNPTTEFWRNQPRAEAWTLILCVRAHYLGFNTCDPELLSTYCKGWTPRKALREYVKKILAAGVDPQVGGQPDPRVFKVLPDKDWHGYGKQCQGGYVWQPAVRHWAYAYVLRSQILEPSEAEALKAHALADVQRYKDWAFDSARGMSWCLNRTEMPRADAELLMIDIDANGGPHSSRKYEIKDLPNGKSLVVEEPITQDLELHLPAWIYLLGKDSEQVVTLLDRVPKPTSTKYEPKHMDPVWAEMER